MGLGLLLLHTNATLVVGDNIHSNDLVDQNEYENNTNPSIVNQRKRCNRKRKRRPQFAVDDNSTGETANVWHDQVADEEFVPIAPSVNLRTDRNTSLLSRTKKQPAVREPLAALEKEQKRYELRDKSRLDTSTISPSDKSYRRPYSQAKKELQTGATTDIPSTNFEQGTGTKSAIDLKNILKNSGGLSLSEFLQQKNLSLDDLLKGKQNALLALQTTAASPEFTATAAAADTTKQTKTSVRKLASVAPTFNATLAINLTSTTATNGNSTYKNWLHNDSAETTQRLKVLTTQQQRLKLFDTASRIASTTATIASRNTITTRRREQHKSTATTKTSTTVTTTRVPLYKRRLQYRPTLKPPFLLKSSIMPTIAVDLPTPPEVATMTETVQNSNDTTDINNTLHNEGTTTEVMQQEESQEQNEEENHITNMTKKLPTSTEGIKKKKITTSRGTSPTFTKTTTSTTNNYNNVKSNIKLKNKEHSKNFEVNFIEQRQAKLTTAPANSAAGTEDDDDGLEDFFDESTTKIKEVVLQNYTPSFRSRDVEKTTTARTANDIDTNNIDNIDDRTDLLELIEDRRSGNRLFKVLEQRNMTLEELIEHRKRGASQLHLSMVLQNNTGLFPGQKVVLHDNMDIVTAFENFPHFNLVDLKSVKPDDIKTDSQGASYFTSITDIEPTDEVYKTRVESSIKDNTFIPTQRTDKSLSFFPSWKNFALTTLDSAQSADTKNNQFYLPQPKLLLESASQELGDENLGNNTEISFETAALIPTMQDTVGAIENDVTRAHDLVDLELSGHGFKRSPAAAISMANQQNGNSLYSNMPAGIRSAIVASTAIVLTALITFLAIFGVCRWKQHRLRKAKYLKTYNTMKSKLPTLGVTAAATRRSSSRNMEEMMGCVSTITTTPNQKLQRQSSLLFAQINNETRATSCLDGSCTNTLKSGEGRRSRRNSIGIGSATSSTTSLALSLCSAHNISATKLNTMDTNSPEVQEYLFDTLRKSF
ncbi:uncharacterized protein LOC119666580 [Teleopsis dalmanni]|uniref:uncharacterized protein LOC119666580 n=1 Tax=Teleopsis dalmanni TaxID=139649 RepID=UPI0018CE38D8|nr:uncharacterized protein LOC119666580 [Teleopsis dalmanni]